MEQRLTLSTTGIEEFELAVLQQRPIDPGHYGAGYFQDDWRDAGNKYDLETRRRLEAQNPLLIKRVFAPSRVLDIGCGPGFLMYFLHELGVEADGVDFSEDCLQLAPSAIRDRIVVAPVTDPPVEDNAYDVVICREVMEHLTVVQIRRTVAAICRASSRFVYVTTRFHPKPTSLLDFTTQFEIDPTHITLLNKDFLRLLFVLEGFKRRADLEDQMDWANKARVLCYEQAA